MFSFLVKAKIDRIVTQDVEVIVEAKTEDAAIEIAREALADWPNPTATPEVKRIRPNKFTFWIPRTIDITSSERIYRDGQDFNNPG